ncbi:MULTISPECIES: deoxyguanosinetriphosphate triphosphohydrolase family protein [Desulfococcus]|uniref:Phosphohydrolase-associated domain containing protein n=1 Tax=Desulfococcus multivorans DSM 2059 TaxID=1121405 RepID=S7TAA5_DESML|nr:HD domain-containing protein [Desulfococcus multivorans]AQV01189.1 phosphohydrolase [Desulfococcus multivorans]EPR34052.1 Phosphohydrolase-associated domain containing protein [Desulfococcus multivorans DSM 2059]MDX9818432.1 HD domain-containing protein [Desulfococcus multivorans]SJZ53073.1 dGTPase [Desulfococcus multivorans DSM 2059]
MQNLGELQEIFNRREARILSPSAALSRDGRRRKTEDRIVAGYRQAYSLDVDRILHSLAYTRYIDKTQVFYLVENDHITHRVLHVQLVSKISRTIGRFLGLNEDLIEAIALGHDIGHVPFGHEGENFLSKLCRDHGIGHFRHNVQSVQFLDKVERKGRGWNLCLQTLDGILCHDGEIHNQRIAPARGKTFENLDRETDQKKADPDTVLTPMTLEGCVVRFSDTIGYIGRDIEDAIRLGLIRRSDLPRNSVSLLGDTNGSIVYALVTDIIKTSADNDTIAFSDEISHALNALKAFNYDRIYLNPVIKKHSNTLKTLFDLLFNRYLEDLEKGDERSGIYTRFFSDMSDEYKNTHSNEEVVRDFIAGMTDTYFLNQCPPELRPMPFKLPFASAPRR